MATCTHNITSSPITVFSSCQFQKITKIFHQGQADVVCGIMDVCEFTGEVAMKCFLTARGSKQEMIDNELTTWRLLCPHPNIASFIGTAPTNNYKPCYMPVGTVSDYYVNGNLSEFLRKFDPDRREWARRLELRPRKLIGVSRGLKHIHEQSIVHGDLKAANIVVDAEGKLAKICDFGSSIIECVCYNGPKDREGTVAWDSPELFMEDDSFRTKESDIWAFGCAALEIQMSIMPWDPEGSIDRVMARQLRGGYPARLEWLSLGDNQVLLEVWDLMKECWKEEPSDRPAPESLVGWLEDIAAAGSVTV